MLCNSLGSVKLCKPGQAASGIRSVPGHAGAGRDPGGAAGESPGGSLWLSSLWAPALLQQGCQWGTLELAGAGSGRRFLRSTAISEQCRQQRGLVFCPLTQCWQMNLSRHSLCLSVTRGCCFWLKRQQLFKNFSVPQNFLCYWAWLVSLILSWTSSHAWHDCEWEENTK